MVSLVDRMKTRIAGLSHATTLAHGALLAAFFAFDARAIVRAARTSAHELARVAARARSGLVQRRRSVLERPGLTADGGAPGGGVGPCGAAPKS